MQRNVKTSRVDRFAEIFGRENLWQLSKFVLSQTVIHGCLSLMQAANFAGWVMCRAELKQFRNVKRHRYANSFVCLWFGTRSILYWRWQEKDSILDLVLQLIFDISIYMLTMRTNVLWGITVNGFWTHTFRTFLGRIFIFRYWQRQPSL